MRRRCVLATAALMALSTTAWAQAFPERPITVIVPFAAGGPTDTVARLISESMTASLGQQVIVENVGGAGGTLGAGRVAKADPDGYTLLLHHIGQATSASLYRKLPYKPGEAFAPVGLVTDVPMTIVARSDFAPANVAELIEYIKTNKDQVTLANAGIGSASHLCGMLLMDALDTPMTTVPYKGTGPAMTDLMGCAGRPDVRPDHQHHQSDQGRQDQGLRRHHQDAGAVPARSADAGFLGPARFRGRRLARPLRAGRDAARGGRQAGRPPSRRRWPTPRWSSGSPISAPSRRQPTAPRRRHWTRSSSPRSARWQPIIEAAGVYAD